MEDPDTLARRLYTANLGLVDLLIAVAQELERMASVERYGDNRADFLARAQRIRKRVHDGFGRDEFDVE